MSTAQTAGYDTAGSSILLVEDNPDDSLLLQRAFRRAGVRNPIHLEGDGEKAIAYLSTRTVGPLQAPALVLLDLKLPRRSGFEVLAWAKAQPLVKRLPIVVLTSSKESVDLARAYELGANSYLVKPASSAHLTALVEHINGYWLSLNESPPLS
jgi:CheY-like chemotaxis protein